MQVVFIVVLIIKYSSRHHIFRETNRDENHDGRPNLLKEEIYMN